MHRPSPVLLLALAGATTLGACTFNVGAIDATESAEHTGALERLEVSLPDVEEVTGEVELVVRPQTTPSFVATIGLVGLARGGVDEATLLEPWELGWTPTDVGAALDLIPDPATAQWLRSIDVLAPGETEVVIEVGSSSVDVEGLTGRVEVTSSSGSMDVRTGGVVDLSASSGSIHVAAEAGTLRTESGSMEIALDGWVTASASSGSIVGSIGDGGSLTTESGSMDVIVTRALTRDLTLMARSGSIVVHVPGDAPLSIDLAAESGGVRVRLPGVSHDGRSFSGDLAGGGPTLVVRTESGSIQLVAD